MYKLNKIAFLLPTKVNNICESKQRRIHGKNGTAHTSIIRQSQKKYIYTYMKHNQTDLYIFQ